MPPQPYSEPSLMYVPMGAFRHKQDHPDPHDVHERKRDSCEFAPHSLHPSLAWQGPPPLQAQAQQQQGPPPAVCQDPRARTFQGQFHTSFDPVQEASPPLPPLPLLPMPPVPPGTRPGSSKGKHKRERDWERERDARERDTREHERELYNCGVPGVPLSIPDTEWDAVNGLPVQTPTLPPVPREPPERVFRTKQSVSLGSYVYPVTPFPYAFLAELADVPAVTTGKLLEDKTTGTSTPNPLATATKDKPDVTSDTPATSEPEDPELLALKHTPHSSSPPHTSLGPAEAGAPVGRGCTCVGVLFFGVVFAPA
ncbi:hypothetical protein B0H14DRAFT_3453710 [Mycena olivaceomarginata]|nr:hypothetical protein B0H14DRAFT_3453710 [Mycena olivaceomarginata]